MRPVNPLLKTLSNINEIKTFGDSLYRGSGATLILTSSVARSYFIGAIALNNKLVVISDDAFFLYHESAGVNSLQVQYLPNLLSSDLAPKMFNKSITKHLSTLANSLVDEKPDVIFTESNLDLKVPESLLAKKKVGFDILVGDTLLIDTALNKLNEYGYAEKYQAKNIGDYAHRGGIIDFFPNNTKNPVRIEFDGDVISSIRFYNPTSQLSVNNTNKIHIPDFKKDIKRVFTITYRTLLEKYGYKIINENLTNKECHLKYRVKNIDENIGTLQIRNLYLKNIKELRKYEHELTVLYVVGADLKKRSHFPIDSIYIEGYINENIIIEGCGIAVVGVQHKIIKHLTTPKKEIENYYSFKWGDFITHVDYGVGIYRGLIRKHDKDYVKLEYTKNATVLLSAQRLDMIAPHIGQKKPILNNIGGSTWSLKKTKTRKIIRDIIGEMVAVNKNRQTRREIPYKTDDYLEKSLGESFPYIETEDQRAAILDIYKDMISPGLMDRLIIGDVGFGKTEVALRAAAKAAFSGVFVMVIVPTTILADQHYILFKNRLESFGVNVEMLSRFIPTIKQKEIINNIVDKKIDILIGTHKLLSDSVPKNKLGLLVIDEEHRFGVVHKNKLLKIKQSIDVITLTATPIPRTLQQSLLGLKSVSLINTPPVKRVPIKTQVIYQNWDFYKKIMVTEISRGGQVYFLHNRIESIPFYIKKIKEMFPDANIAYAHGGMNSKDLEEIILSFFDGNIQVLVTTTIIEAGLDVPNANTIIITGSHMYGLSQLYQIRGRVGRGNRQGFCYLVIPKEDGLSESAIERLKTIQENTDLGSGYSIAIKDLEIRGAGNVFGYEQSGHISSVGYHLYCKMFNEELSKSNGAGTNIHVPKIQYYGNASFNDSYMSLSQDRLYYYQRLSNAKNKHDISAVREEVTDRYGKPGPGTTNLYKITEIRTVYTNTLVKNILIEKDRIMLTLRDPDPKTEKELSINGLMDALESAEIKYMFKQVNKDAFGLDIVCSVGDEPLTMLIQNAELFYYNNNNT